MTCRSRVPRTAIERDAARNAARIRRELGETLRTMREDAGLSLGRVAAMSGVSKSHLNDIEAGRVRRIARGRGPRREGPRRDARSAHLPWDRTAGPGPHLGGDGRGAVAGPASALAADARGRGPSAGTRRHRPRPRGARAADRRVRGAVGPAATRAAGPLVPREGRRARGEARRHAGVAAAPAAALRPTRHARSPPSSARS